MTATVNVDGASVRFGRTVAIEDVSLHIEPGELVGIVGPSGAGKTTLLRLLLGELTPSAGSVGIIAGQAPTNSSAVGYVPQLESSERGFPLTVQGAVELGAAGRSRWVPWFTRDERTRATHALERLGIGELRDRSLHELSGGQFQRVLFARALCSQPSVLLLDEPTSGIDLHTRAEMLRLVDELRADGLTVVLTTHDLNWVAAHLPRIVCINRRIVADGSPADVLRRDVLADTFGADVEVIWHDDRPVIVDRTSPVAGHDRVDPPAGTTTNEPGRSS